MRILSVLALVLFLTGAFSGCFNKNKSVKKINYADQFKSNKIINGELVEDMTTPLNSVVGLYDSVEDFTCTGVLVSKNLILTAAHCIEKNGQGLHVFFTQDLYTSIDKGVEQSENQEVRKVVFAQANEGYTEEHIQKNEYDWNDIALVKFEGDIPVGYAPAQLDTSMPKESNKLLVAGFGVAQVTREPVTEEQMKTIDDKIKSGEVICYGKGKYDMCYNVVMKGDGPLQKTEITVAFTEDTEFVTDEQKTGTCLGDSGGPVYRKANNGQYYLTGITSRGANTCNVDGVYTAVSAQKKWIDKTTEVLLAK